MSKNIGLILYQQTFEENKTSISDIENKFYSGLDSRYFVIKEVLSCKLDIPILSLKISDHKVKYYKLTNLLKQNKLFKYFIYALLILLNIQKKQKKINALKIIQLNQSKKNISYLCLRIDEIHRIDIDILTNAKIKIIIDIDDNHFARSPRIKNFFAQFFFKICVAQIIKQIKTYSSAVFVSNENDINDLWDKHRLNAFHIPNYLIDSEKFKDFLSLTKTNNPKKRETQCLYVANFNYGPNFDGLIWLLEILKNDTDNKIITLESPIPILKIVGLKPRDKIKLRVLEEQINYLNSKGFYQIQMVGFVENIKNIYDSSDLVLVPISSGMGTCVKTLEAISYNKPILTTTCGWRGLPLEFNFNHTTYPVISNNSEDWIYIINNFNQLNYNLDYRYIVKKYCINTIVKTLNLE